VLSGLARAFVLGFILLAWPAGQARAQWGMGWGWGLGLRTVPSPQEYLNQHALTRAAAGRPAAPSFSPYANNPNAYINRLRDPGFTSHYDVSRRAAPTYRPAPRARPAPAQLPTVAPEIALAPPLASFFNAAQKLVWPNEAPTAGDLQEKRDAADQASLAVLEETKRQTTASLSSATYAREQLIAYGQPALKEVRAQSTPVIADTFHAFLLALYDSLAQAATPDLNGGDAPKP
jgi:hypothetical protein